MQIKLIEIGNSRGIRLPKKMILKYHMENQVDIIEREDGLLLKSPAKEQMTWEETYKQMAAEREDWSDFEDAVGDGIKYH